MVARQRLERPESAVFWSLHRRTISCVRVVARQASRQSRAQRSWATWCGAKRVCPFAAFRLEAMGLAASPPQGARAIGAESVGRGVPASTADILAEAQTVGGQQRHATCHCSLRSWFDESYGSVSSPARSSQIVVGDSGRTLAATDASAECPCARCAPLLLCTPGWGGVTGVEGASPEIGLCAGCRVGNPLLPA